MISPHRPEYVAQVRHAYGLDQPLPVQVLRYVGHELHGDLGYSFANRQPVLTLILGRLGATLELTGTALGFASLVGITLGVLAARRPGGALDRVARTLATTGFALPEFWVGQILILVFAIRLGWLPSQGSHAARGAPAGLAGLLDGLRYLVLPAFALSLRYLALITRITRASMLEVLGADYILASPRARRQRAGGAGHACAAQRGGAGDQCDRLQPRFSSWRGSALVETVFGWPGIGRLLYESISSRDTPTMMAILLLVSATVVLANLATDILHRLLDPRVT